MNVGEGHPKLSKTESLRSAEYSRMAGIFLDLLTYYFWMIAAMLLYLRDV